MVKMRDGVSLATDIYRPSDLTGPLPLADMCRDTPSTPLRIPLHRAAERYWRDSGYLT